MYLCDNKGRERSTENGEQCDAAQIAESYQLRDADHVHHNDHSLVEEFTAAARRCGDTLQYNDNASVECEFAESESDWDEEEQQ